MMLIHLLLPYQRIVFNIYGIRYARQLLTRSHKDIQDGGISLRKEQGWFDVLEPLHAGRDHTETS